jgi:hypothetical protein
MSKARFIGQFILHLIKLRAVESEKQTAQPEKLFMKSQV